MHETGILSYNNSPKKLQRILIWRTRKENLFLKGYTATKPNQIWVSDITLFRMNSRDYYICAYMDVYSRRIVSYTIGRSASTHLVKMSLIRACSVRKQRRGSLSIRMAEFNMILGACAGNILKDRFGILSPVLVHQRTIP